MPTVASEVTQRENVARCKHWALRNMKPLEYAKFENLDPFNMTDLERVLWADILFGGDRTRTSIGMGYDDDGKAVFWSDHLEWCVDYWSEPLSPENAEKRNSEALRVECLMRLAKRGNETEGLARRAYGNHEDTMTPVVVNQAARLLSWIDMEGAELLALDEKPHVIVSRVWHIRNWNKGRYRESNRAGNWPRATSPREDVEWWGIEDLWLYDQMRYCRAYYPQLFVGRWVPLDTYGAEERLEKANERFALEQESDYWPEWMDEPQSGVIIRLNEGESEDE